MAHTCNCAGSTTAGQAAETAATPFIGSMPAKTINFVVSIFTCQRNINIITGVFATGSTAFIAKTYRIFDYFFKFKKFSEPIPYKPFALSTENLPSSITVFENKKIVKGTSESDLIISHPDGSEIFAIGGLNFIVLGEGPDTIYSSLCSTDIINNKVSVVKDFTLSRHKMKFFCTKAYIHQENVTILHEKINDTDITYIHVAGLEKNSAIALIGNIELNNSDITLNEKWPYIDEVL